MLSPTIFVKNTELDIKPINFTILGNSKNTAVFIVIFLEVG